MTVRAGDYVRFSKRGCWWRVMYAGSSQLIVCTHFTEATRDIVEVVEVRAT